MLSIEEFNKFIASKPDLSNLIKYMGSKIMWYDPICTYGTYKGCTFYTHGYVDHECCGRRCIKDCAICYIQPDCY